MSDEERDYDAPISEWEDEDEVLDLRAVAPPRKRVQVDDELIVTLKSPREFGTRDQARLQQIQARIAKLQRGRLTTEKAAELSQLYRDVVRMILVDASDAALEQLTDNDVEGLALVFTARWIEYMRKLSDASGAEVSLDDLARMHSAN